MARYVLIESRDPFESNDVAYYFGLAGDLAERGEQVSVFLVQNAALAARKGAATNPLEALLGKKVEVLLDSFSAAERGVVEAERLAGVKPSDIDALVAAIMQDNTKVMWH
jgi:sulfur relay (sulfurtransferase) complex TusBCD TusD component (DsrE family)